MAVDRVAGSSWNQWPDADGLSGRMAWNAHLDGLINRFRAENGPESVQKSGVQKTLVCDLLKMIILSLQGNRVEL